MAALDRYDAWESTVDALLAGQTDNCAGDTSAEASSVPGFDEVYDPETQAAIERGGSEPDAPAAVSRWRGGVAAGALSAGLLGVARAVEDRPGEEPVVELDRAGGRSRLEPVTVHLAWGNPAASVAVVRRWLL